MCHSIPTHNMDNFRLLFNIFRLISRASWTGKKLHIDVRSERDSSFSYCDVGFSNQHVPIVLCSALRLKSFNFLATDFSNKSNLFFEIGHRFKLVPNKFSEKFHRWRTKNLYLVVQNPMNYFESQLRGCIKFTFYYRNYSKILNHNKPTQGTVEDA